MKCHHFTDDTPNISGDSSGMAELPTPTPNRDARTLNVPSREELNRLAQQSDQSHISEQELEQSIGRYDESVRNPVDGDIPLPTGERQDEDPLPDDDDLLRHDMVNAGD
jgi:hypothetical protein